MASISDKVAQIRQAVYGKDVRESIASGIEAINEEVENTTSRQNVLETTFEQLIINAGNSNAEIVAARVDAEGTAYPTLGDRLNAADAAFREQKTEIIHARGGFDTLRKKLDSYAINVKDFGAKGDGVTDDTQAIQTAFQAAVSQGKKLFFPNGTYRIETLLTVTNDINSPDAEKRVDIEGESPTGVILTSSTLSTIADFSKSKHVFLKNLLSNKFIKVMNYGEDERLNAQREVFVQNVINTSESGEPINWYLLINAPQPPSGYADNGGGAYSRYPLEITNHSGYNSIMINHFSKSGEASAIGITERGTAPDGSGLATPTILIDRTGAKRPIFQVQDSTQPYRHPIRNAIFEIDDYGNIAIGTSTLADDGGFANLKIKQPTPTVKLIDPTTGRTFTMYLSGNNINMSGGVEISVTNNEVWGFPKFKTNLEFDGGAIIMKTPDGTKRYKISIDNNGQLITTPV